VSEPRSELGGERGSDGARRVGLLLGPFLFVVLLAWPDLPLDDAQRRVAAVTVLTAIWWITVALPVGATALLPAALFPLLGVMSAKTIAPMYMRDLVMLFLGAFIIALGLERWGVHRRIALFILSRVGGSPRRLVLGFMAASAFLSLWINNTATTLLMLPIALAVLSRVEGEREDGSRPASSPFGICLLLGVAYAASVGGMGTPVGTAPNQEFLGQFDLKFEAGPKITFGQWFFGWIPLVLLFVPCAWWLLTRVVYQIESESTAGAEVIREERAHLGPMTRPQFLMSMVFATTAVLWVTRADITLGSLRLPGWSRLFLASDPERPEWYEIQKNYISDATVASFMALLCFVLPGERGNKGDRRYLMDWKTANRLPWEVLLLLGGGFCLAAGFKESGLDQRLGQALSPLMEGHSSWLVVGGVVLFMSLLTEVTSNTATTAVLLPVIAEAGVSAGLDPLMVMVPATIAASAAFMMPVATPPNAVVFGSRRVSVPEMVRTGMWLNVLAVILITLVFQLWVRWLWGIEDSLPSWATGS
jgi:solute carrier family 13 (sodium-dependent dicarboxylate transporter), member 2/3/5